MLLEKDGFHYEKTPTNEKHIKFLRSLDCIRGMSVNSNLYTQVEEIKNDQIEESEEETPKN